MPAGVGHSQETRSEDLSEPVINRHDSARSSFDRLLQSPLFLIFSLTLITRLLFLAFYVSDPQRLFYDPDSQGYYNLAVNLIDHGVFSQDATPPRSPDNLRTPLYPFFLAALFALFGKSLVAVAVAQIVVSAATVVLVYGLARRLSGTAAAVVAAVLFGLDLSSFVYAHAILTETLFTFLFLGAVGTLAVALRTPKVPVLLLSGGLVGLAALCRPVALYYVIPAGSLVWLASTGKGHRRLRHSFLVLIAFTTVVTPWVLRNARVFGVANFSGIQGVNLLLVNAAYLEADRLGMPVDEMDETLEREAESQFQGRNLNLAERTRVYQRLGVHKILDHPWRYAWVHLKGILPALLDNNVRDLRFFRSGDRVFFGARDLLISGGPVAALRAVWRSEHRSQILLFAASVFVQLAVYGLAVAGAVVLWRKGSRLESGLLVLTIVYLIFMTAPAGSVRFRFPSMPYIDLLAGIGAVTFARALKRKRERDLA